MTDELLLDLLFAVLVLGVATLLGRMGHDR